MILDTAGPGGTVVSGGYLNLAAEAGVSRVRDKSTCVHHLHILLPPHLLITAILDYHGVQRGKKHWERQNYDD